jgi:hypothetical protein
VRDKLEEHTDKKSRALSSVWCCFRAFLLNVSRCQLPETQHNFEFSDFSSCKTSGSPIQDKKPSIRPISTSPPTSTNFTILSFNPSSNPTSKSLETSLASLLSFPTLRLHYYITTTCHVSRDRSSTKQHSPPLPPFLPTETYILKLNLQALLRCFRALSFHIVDFLMSLCQFLVHVVNKAVVSRFPNGENGFVEKL